MVRHKRQIVALFVYFCINATREVRVGYATLPTVTVRCIHFQMEPLDHRKENRLLGSSFVVLCPDDALQGTVRLEVHRLVGQSGSYRGLSCRTGLQVAQHIRMPVSGFRQPQHHYLTRSLVHDNMSARLIQKQPLLSVSHHPS